MKANRILVGGQALRNLGSDRYTNDVDYLIQWDDKTRFDWDGDGSDFIKEVKSNFLQK